MDTIKQVGRITKKSTNLKSGKEREKVSFIISSLLPVRSDAKALMHYIV